MATKTLMKQEVEYAEQLTKLLITNPQRDLVQAAKLYAQLSKRSPGMLEQIKEQVAFRHWGRLEAVAYGALDVRLVYAYSIGAHRLRGMPLKVQGQALDEGVRLLLPNGEHLQITIQNLTADQANQIFDTKNMCLRNDAAQRAYLESRKTALTTRKRKAKPDYEIRNGRVRINRFMTPREVLAILAKV